MNTIFQRLSGGRVFLCSGPAWVVVYFLVRGLLEAYQFTEGLRIVVALIPIIPFVFFLIAALLEIRQMDELHRRVHLEALAIAFPLTMLMFMILGLLELAIPLSPDDWSYHHVWYFPPIFYLLGMWIAWRRYQ